MLAGVLKEKSTDVIIVDINIVLWILCIFSVGFTIEFERRAYLQLSAISKGLASISFVLIATFSGIPTDSFGQLMCVGLLLSLFGDMFLVRMTPQALLLGLSAFLFAHIAYALAFIVGSKKGDDTDLNGIIFSVSTLILWAGGAKVYRWLYPSIPQKLRIPTIIYVIVIGLMGGAAYQRGVQDATWMLPIGATLFWLSDISVARRRFHEAGLSNRIWGLPAYYLAQLIFAQSV